MTANAQDVSTICFNFILFRTQHVNLFVLYSLSYQDSIAMNMKQVVKWDC